MQMEDGLIFKPTLEEEIMISAYEMEKMANAATDSFSDNSYDAILADAWLNAQRRKMERQQRRAEAVQKIKNAVAAWLQSFQNKSFSGV